jgi:hypothetical protein
MMKEQHNSEWYLRDPRTRKWMVQCIACKRWGYRHDAPPKFFGRSMLERHFEAMTLNERGVCSCCQAES